METSPHLIAEIANFHGGDPSSIYKIIDVLADAPYVHKSIKFQPFAPETIALPDFEYYPVYEKLAISAGEWQQLIETADSRVGAVWLDLFDSFGVEILNQNRAKVFGIKLQASVLENDEVFSGLAEHGLEGLELMLNISGYDLDSIRKVAERFKSLSPKRLILQLGYQRYPTEIQDSALNKIPVLQEAFPDLPLCLADHVDAKDPFARRIPLVAAAIGCAYIEKHVCLNRELTEYDHYSALEPEEMFELMDDLDKLQLAYSGEFVSTSEAAYLKKSYQYPILRSDMPVGATVAKSDLLFRRTDQEGLTFTEVQRIQNQRQVLSHSTAKGTTLKEQDFKEARVGVIVACRMKSSRLKRKAQLPIHGVPSVERCLQNVCMISGLSAVVLATSTEEEDACLEENAKKADAEFVKGDPDDVILRYLDACDRHGIDVVVRVTGDCPVASPEIADFLLESHFASGADFTAPNKFAVGTNSEIYNVSALRRVIELLGQAKYSEYMGFYMRNNTDLFKVNMVNLPQALVRDYRLTLDYPEDLEMFNRLYQKLDQQSLPATAENVFKILDNDASIAALNSGMVIKYETDKELIDMLNRETRIPT